MKYLVISALLLLFACDNSTGPDSNLYNYWYLESSYTISPSLGAQSTTPDVGWIIYISEDSLYRYVAYGTEWKNNMISEGWFDSTKVSVNLITCTESEIKDASDNSKLYGYKIINGKLKLTNTVQLLIGQQQTETGTLEETYTSYSGDIPPENWPPLEMGE